MLPDGRWLQRTSVRSNLSRYSTEGRNIASSARLVLGSVQVGDKIFTRPRVQLPTAACRWKGFSRHSRASRANRSPSTPRTTCRPAAARTNRHSRDAQAEFRWAIQVGSCSETTSRARDSIRKIHPLRGQPLHPRSHATGSGHSASCRTPVDTSEGLAVDSGISPPGETAACT